MTSPEQTVITTEESVELLTVGIDIGSATSQLVFSRLRLEKVGSRYVVVERLTVYQSDVVLTPYAGDSIDGGTLREIVDRAYAAAGFTPEAVDTGALIVTGVALNRHNARVIADVFSAEAGKFVTVSAGDHLEAVMAAHGSGALGQSGLSRSTVLNIDIGGGTTKLALCGDGSVKSVAAVDVGARLITFDARDTDDGKTGRTVATVEDAGAAAAERIGLTVRPGMVVTADQIRALASELADCVMSAIPGTGITGKGGLRTEPLRTGGLPAAVNFSGGVSEYVYGREQRAFDDLGPALADAVAARVRALGVPALPPTAGIRATVLGVSQYAVQVSGSTIAVSSAGLLPLRNVPVAGPAISIGQPVDRAGITSAIRSGLSVLKQPGPTALALRWTGSATWDRLDALCHAILAGVQPVLAAGHPVVLVFDQDVSQLVGRHLELEMNVSADLICIDCVELRQFDYIDVGAPLTGASAVPVVIKSLVFSGAGGSADS